MKNMRGKKVIFLLLIVLVVTLSLYTVYSFDLMKYIVPIYKMEDRSREVLSAKKKYKDENIVGWIRVQGTDIDYPIIMKSESMHASFADNLEYSWVNIKPKEVTNYLMVLGHNIRNVSSQPIIGDSQMKQFEQLMSYIYYDFSKDNKYIQYTINGKNYLYQIFAVSLVDSKTLDYDVDSYSKEKLRKYIENAKEMSYFDYDVEVDENDKIISLVTCTRFQGYQYRDFKIDAKLIENKKGYDYNVSKNDNYDEIEEILKGVDDVYA